MKRYISIFLFLLILFSSAAALSACGGTGDPTPPVCESHTDSDGDGVCDSEGCNEPVAPAPPAGGGEGTTALYSITLTSEGGLRLSDVRLDIYDSETGALVTRLDTDGEGKASATLTEKGTYVARIRAGNFPYVGYSTEGDRALKSGENLIKLKAELPTGGFTGLSLSLYDIMPDFTLTATDGRVLNLSSLLEEKRAVVINLWFVNCNFCKEEFPDMIAAYEAEIEGAGGKKYKDEIELIALNPIDRSDVDILEIVDTFSLSCPVAKDACGIAGAFNPSGYPTTVVIDRYGMITLIHSNPIMGEGAWRSLFDTYIAEDYSLPTD